METKKKVLVVDDDPLSVKLMAARLLVAGYDVIKAYDGQEALTQAFMTQPDIILLDIMMPGMDGYEVTARIKENAELKSIPIVLLTGLAGIDEKVQGLNAGADDFLTKPVNQMELLARIRSLIKLKKLQEELTKKDRDSQLYAEAQTNIKALQKKIILIVEDEETTAISTTLILEKAGYEVISVKNGSEARIILDKAIPDLILLDILLPDINGLDLLTEIKANSAMEHIPVIIVSALDDLETKVRGIETGADDYLVKPVNFLEMLARIRANLRKTEISSKLKLDLNVAVTQAITDMLTRLYNRHYLPLHMEREIASAKRHGKVFSVLMIDIDHFKNINDTFGHLAGDSVLKEIGTILKKTVRTEDIAVRYGGEEFVLILQEAGIKGATVAAEHARKKVEQHHFSNVNGATITVSIGATEFRPEDSSMDMIIARADYALYQAKQTGRNRVVAFNPA